MCADCSDRAYAMIAARRQWCYSCVLVWLLLYIWMWIYVCYMNALVLLCWREECNNVCDIIISMRASCQREVMSLQYVISLTVLILNMITWPWQEVIRGWQCSHYNTVVKATIAYVYRFRPKEGEGVVNAHVHRYKYKWFGTSTRINHTVLGIQPYLRVVRTPTRIWHMATRTHD